MVFRVAGRRVRPLAKAPLFDHPLIGTVLRGLGGLPVYRRQDDPALTHLNNSAFDAAIAALQRSEAVLIFPEGQSHSEPSLAPLKTGAARIALLAEERSGWAMGLHVVPVGLTYVRKDRFRGRVLATVGKAVSIAPWQGPFRSDPDGAVLSLTEDIARGLDEVTLNLESESDRGILELAEGLYSREKGWVRWRERETLDQRLPRLKAFARALARLRAYDPDRYRSLSRDVERYRRFLVLFGAREGDVPPEYSPGSVLLYAVREVVALLALALPAAIGVVAWWIPYAVPRLVTSTVRPGQDAIATYRLGTALITFPAAWLVWIAVGLRWGGTGWALLIAVGLPLAGLASLAFLERWRRVAEDLMVFVRALPSGRGRDRLSALRGDLVARFDAVAQELGMTPGA